MSPNTDVLSRHKRPFAFLYLLLVVMAPSLAHATILKSFDLHDLTQRADFVAVVRVEAKTCLRDGPRNFIYTDHTVQIREIVHHRDGLRAPRIGERALLRQIGGRIGDIQQSVVGTEDIRDGDELVVFVRMHKGRLYLVGMHQGGWFLDSNSVVRPSRAQKDPDTQGLLPQGKTEFLKRIRKISAEVRR
jgi:hypothetical protein